MCACMCVCVCACAPARVCEKERMSDREQQIEANITTDMSNKIYDQKTGLLKGMCVCVCVCVCV